ncbi:ROK family protein [Microbacterium betulae]|uniref:ROK family protein n=1 Tax=Microbacterium betulae TaxID=2981139 RepID=A0AA97I6J0_9MICO|nr:ROK family protein [Microbacterium sp. AB]WOF23187.1 ROK family protein [Microbacterium sp. AB]
MPRRMDPRTSPGAVFELIHTGRADSRAAVTRILGVAPSTVSARVNHLIERGLVVEQGVVESTGGRQARLLEIRADAGYVACLQLGATHATLWISDLRGTRRSESSPTLDLGAGAAEFVKSIWRAIVDASRALGFDPAALRGILLGFPAPVDQRRGVIGAPSLVPSLQGVDIAEFFRAHTSAWVLVENDANLLAVGETALQPEIGSNVLAIKLGRRIGAGLILDGELFRGDTGAAGEIGHQRVAGTSAVGCTCGVESCLESVASGGAIIARLRSMGYDVTTTSDVVRISQTHDSTVAGILREGGERIGEVLAGMANMLNPSAIVFGGVLASCENLIAAVRATVFALALPVVSSRLTVTVGRGAADAEGRGATTLILRRVLSREVIDRELAGG